MAPCLQGYHPRTIHQTAAHFGTVLVWDGKPQANQLTLNGGPQVFPGAVFGVREKIERHLSNRLDTTRVL